MRLLLHLPPQSDWYVHEYRSKDTKLLHSVATVRRNYRRKPGARALCATRLEKAWRRPPGSPPVQRCERCMDAVAALSDLLDDQ